LRDIWIPKVPFPSSHAESSKWSRAEEEQAPADVGEIVIKGVVDVVEGWLYAQLSNGWGLVFWVFQSVDSR